MLSFAREMFHCATAGVFEEEEWERRPRRIYGPCHHIAGIECDRCRGARREHEPRRSDLHRCEKCGGYFTSPDFVEHYPRCSGR